MLHSVLTGKYIDRAAGNWSGENVCTQCAKLGNKNCPHVPSKYRLQSNESRASVDSAELQFRNEAAGLNTVNASGEYTVPYVAEDPHSELPDFYGKSIEYFAAIPARKPTRPMPDRKYMPYSKYTPPTTPTPTQTTTQTTPKSTSGAPPAAPASGDKTTTDTKTGTSQPPPIKKGIAGASLQSSLNNYTGSLLARSVSVNATTDIVPQEMFECNSTRMSHANCVEGFNDPAMAKYQVSDKVIKYKTQAFY